MDIYELAYNYRLYAENVKPQFIEAYREMYGVSLLGAIAEWENASPARMKEVIETYAKERSTT